MKINHIGFLIFLIFLFFEGLASAQAQNNPRASYEAFKKQAKQRYEDFRSKANKQYAGFLAQAWKSFETFSPIPKPVEEDITPVKYDEESYKKYRRKPRLKEGEKEYANENHRERKHAIAVRHGIDDKEIIIDDDGKEQDDKGGGNDDRKIEIDEIITSPSPQPQPKPISPIYEQDDSGKSIPISFFRLTCPVRLDSEQKIHLKGTNEKHISAAWDKLSRSNYDNAIRDLLELRIKYDLCDWSYLLLIDQVAQQFYGKNTNEAVLFMAYLYCQSGYKMRLASDGTHLYMLYASQHLIYNKMYFDIEGALFYIYGDHKVSSLNICDASFPSETPLSLVVGKEQKIGVDISEARKLTSKQFPNVSVTLNENKTLMDFYSTYPTSRLGSNDVSRWALYANTPICQYTRNQLYPALRQAISGMAVLQQVSVILDWVQTAFVYEYDDKIWGGDRAFFPDETLYYPFCDCEDRSILFSRIVRDLLGLKVALLYYPGHLAAAVCFNENISGDYLIIDGKKFIITDPTYIGAPVGATMPGMDNKSAKVIIL